MASQRVDSRQRVTVRFLPDLHAQVVAEAERRDVSVNRVITAACHQYLDLAPFVAEVIAESVPGTAVEELPQPPAKSGHRHKPVGQNAAGLFRCQCGAVKRNGEWDA